MVKQQSEHAEKSSTLLFCDTLSERRVFAHRYDLVLMDSEMPIMDGTTAMINIRREHGDNTPYMVVVTAAGESCCTYVSVFFSNAISDAW